MLENNLDKQGKRLNRNELKGITGGNIFDPNCPLTCTYQEPGGMEMFGCPAHMDCVPFPCGGPDEYGYRCA